MLIMQKTAIETTIPTLLSPIGSPLSLAIQPQSSQLLAGQLAHSDITTHVSLSQW